MKTRLESGIAGLVLIALFAFMGDPVRAAQPSGFTFTPKFKDPDPGKRTWEKQGNRYIETLPSGRANTFRVWKETTVKGLNGTIVQKVEEPNFYVFIADSEAARPELWWWRDKGPWNFMGRMENIRAPHRID